MHLLGIDYFIIILYFLFVLFLGFWVARKEKGDSVEDYILAGRKLTLPLFVATLVATWYGSILGVGEFVYNSGILAWVCFGLPYYIAALLFALFIAKKIRELKFKTIPEQINSKIGTKSGKMASLIILIITIPSAYTLMLGTLIELITGWSLNVSIILGSFITIVYIYSGGLKSDIITNTFQFVLMYIGFGALLYFAINYFGGFSTVLNKLPNGHLTFMNNKSWQYVLSWFIIAFQTFVDPSFHQRCAAAKTPQTARNGILVSILFWIIFDFLTLSTGLYARANFNIDNPLMSYPVLADKVMPVLWKGLFVISMLATVMSTLDSYAFLSATTLGNDLIYPFSDKFLFIKKYSVKALTKFSLILISLVAILISMYFPSVVEILYNTASISVPGLIIPLLITFNKRYYFKDRSSLIIMISSSCIALLTLILKYFEMNFVQNIEPMIPGILTSIILGIILIRKK